ncbi:MAG: zinc ribbon domain-containing protein [Zetaproteobacteria bacterium]|nr:MAG: zinc ribbon domain-containing protein [Zetaproteobacteria bacterium]
MPIYEYACTDCGHRLEALVRRADETPTACPACGGALERLLSAPAAPLRHEAPACRAEAPACGMGACPACE